MNKTLIKLILLVPIIANLAVRLYGLQNNGVFLKILVPVLLLLCVAVRRWPFLLSPCFFLLGLSLPLFGFQSYSFYNQVFEFLVVVSCCLLISAPCDTGNTFDENSGRRISSPAVVFCLYLILILTSLLLLPLGEMRELFSLWGFLDFGYSALLARPENPLYSLMAVNRAVLFAVFLYLVNIQGQSRRLYYSIFLGCACSVILAVIIGIITQLGQLSLSWYRADFSLQKQSERLHSVFGNPGWFTEYVVVCSPLLLMLIPRNWTRISRGVIYGVLLGILGLALLLSGSRTGWLLFPILIVFYLFHLFFCSEEKNYDIAGKKRVRRRWKKVTALAVIVAIFVGSYAVHHGGSDGGKGDTVDVIHEDFLEKRFENILSPKVRLGLWKESMLLIRESPFSGLGYEAYSWHQAVLGGVKSPYAMNKTEKNWHTPHNLYLQILISNGIVGLVLWGGIILSVMVILCRACRNRQDSLGALLLASLILFHLYGITQAMQYVACIYFIAFLIIGYAISSRENLRFMAAPVRMVSLGVLVMLVVLAVVHYARNYQCRQIAQKYGIEKYNVQHGEPPSLGFYELERSGQNVFWWTGKGARMDLDKGGLIRLSFACYSGWLKDKPLTMTVKLDGEIIDRYTFSKQEKILRVYKIPPVTKEKRGRLSFSVSRVWVPKREGLSRDVRNLGVAVGKPVYISAVSPACLPLLLGR